MSSSNDIKKIKSELENIKIVSELNYYDNPCLVILDAVMSRSRVYEKTVVPRIKYFQLNYSYINSLEKLIAIINEVGVEQFAPKYLDYRFKQLGQVLLDTANVFNDNRLTTNDLESMKRFASSPDYYKEIQKVKGIGIATARYLAILLNIDTVKPDVHILKFISNALDRKVKEQEAVDLLTLVAKEMDRPVAIIDNSIWQHMSNSNNTDIKLTLQLMTLDELIVIKEFVEDLINNKS
ncbi:hypothetical protein JZO80_05885 [Vagococcus fluvialis]|uniref:hypothetical protein n=1 Tax=Vagococcus fluvialis TaxID=2738 RepID=UPI000A354A4D|nr:hypothetical protein [Vagococcus fluvialis]MBO0419687.1 hypothetical protein [Vagococcus fluvialis]OTP29238.1 hypothetical protein A5798_002406 [Enterococcus sp. 6C8_DIV0013]